MSRSAHDKRLLRDVEDTAREMFVGESVHAIVTAIDTDNDAAKITVVTEGEAEFDDYFAWSDAVGKLSLKFRGRAHIEFGTMTSNEFHALADLPVGASLAYHGAHA